jgi:hypothetical protein
MTEKLSQIINNLGKHQDVDGVFITGSQGDNHKQYSDIDLVIVLNNNHHKINSLYTWIDGKFADVFFFDNSDIERLMTKNDIEANSMDAIFIDWLRKATIHFDKSGILNKLKYGLASKTFPIPISEKQQFWQKINYNLVANTRYFQSNDSLYHDALEIRLLYSVSELLCGYFEFRDIPWRGEKTAIKYFQVNDVKFYDKFISYTKASNLGDRFKAYQDLVKLTFTDEYKEWLVGDILPQSKENKDVESMIKYWEDLTN